MPEWRDVITILGFFGTIGAAVWVLAGRLSAIDTKLETLVQAKLPERIAVIESQMHGTLEARRHR